MTDFKAGQRVTLTGEMWDKTSYTTGDTLTIHEVDPDGGGCNFVGDDLWWIFEEQGWEVELNTDTPSEHFAKTPTKERAILEETATRVFGEPQTVHDISSFEQSVHRVTGKIADLLIAKNKAYGDSALNPVRIFSKASRIEQLNVRIDDKISRIQRGTDFGDEDTVRDLIGYLVLRLIAEESE